MSWQTVKLRDVCEIVSGATPKTDQKEFWNGDIFWATPTDLSGLNGKLIKKTERKITEAGLSSCAAKILPKNSVLFSSRAPIGLVAVNDVEMATNQGFKSFVTHVDVLSPHYLYWWLKTNRTYLNGLGVGATFKEVSKSIVERVEIPLPPLAEQKRIAAILDKAAEIRAKREQAIAKLDELAASAFDECCLKSTNQTTTKIKNLVVKRKLAETNDMNVWSLALDQIESNSGQVHSRVMISKAKLGTSTYYFEPDVVLYSKLRPYLNKVVIPETYGYATTELVPLYCDTGKILPVFMAAYLRSSKFVNFANTNSAGAKMPRVMMDKFWDYEMTLPDLGVQRDFQQLSENCNAMKQSLKDCIDKQEQLIASLQHQAFTSGFAA